MLIEPEYKEKIINEELNPCSKAILKTLLYFDIFQYPLPATDIYKYLPSSVSPESIALQLNNLVMQGYIKQYMPFYCLAECDAKKYSEHRMQGTKNAEKLLKTAIRFSKFISYFPFVRGICLSGSLSKGYADEKSDIDYFIITTPGRLWLCRTMLIAFKKFFLFNSHKYFCVNYFVDTNNLEIPDKNIFVATELSSLIPTYSAEHYSRLMQVNDWLNNHHPNFKPVDENKILPENRSILKKSAEWLFNGKIGEWIDDKCFKLTLKAWKKKFDHFDSDEFDLRLRSRKNVSKHHPNGFQEKVLKEYEKRLREFENNYNISLA